MPSLGIILSNQEISSSSTLSATPGATVTLTIPSGRQNLYATWTAGEVETVVTSGAQTAGSILVLKVLNDATLGRVITFGTGFVSNGPITGVVSKAANIAFVSDGTNFEELARTVGI